MATEDATENGAEIRSFVTELAREYLLDAPDRRAEPRYQLTLPVILRPADSEFQPIGAIIRAVTRDLSAGGIGLMCQDPLSCNVIVDFTSMAGRRLVAKAQVLRCDARGVLFRGGLQVRCALNRDRTIFSGSRQYDRSEVETA